MAKGAKAKKTKAEEDKEKAANAGGAKVKGVKTDEAKDEGPRLRRMTLR